MLYSAYLIDTTCFFAPQFVLKGDFKSVSACKRVAEKKLKSLLRKSTGTLYINVVESLPFVSLVSEEQIGEGALYVRSLLYELENERKREKQHNRY